MVPFINFYLHPENQKRYESNEEILKIKVPGWEHFVACCMHLVACLFTDNRFGFFFFINAYLHPENQSQISIHSRDLTIIFIMSYDDINIHRNENDTRKEQEIKNGKVTLKDY